jgi:hypothetical protein
VLPAPWPTASQVVDDPQAMPLRESEENPLGIRCVVQVVPPLSVPITAPVPVEASPTASQVFDDTQAMPLRLATSLGMLWNFHAVPPLFVPRTVPAVEL